MPPLSDGEGVELWGKVCPTQLVLGLPFPLVLSDGAGGIATGARTRKGAPSRPACGSLATPPQIRPLGFLVALWEGSRSSAFGGLTWSRGIVQLEGVKSAEGLPSWQFDVHTPGP